MGFNISSFRQILAPTKMEEYVPVVTHDIEGYITPGSGTFTFLLNGSNVTVSVDSNGYWYYDVPAGTTLTYLANTFYNKTDLLSVEFGPNFDTSHVTNMSSMFYGCNHLTSVDISHFDTGSVRNMSSMFTSCSSLTSLDVSSFDTSNVTDLSYMFQHCNSLTSLDFRNWDTTGVTTYTNFVNDSSSLTAYYTAATFNMMIVYTFQNVNWVPPTQMPLLDIYGHINDGANTFSFNINGNQTVTVNVDSNGDWHYTSSDSSITSLHNMFYKSPYNRNLTSVRFGENNYLPQVTDISGMFRDCRLLTSLNIANLNANNITDANRLFYNCYDLASLDVSNLNTSNVTDMSHMFESCRSLTSLDVSNLDTHNATNMFNMLARCSGLTSLDVSNFVTSKATNMGGMFIGCSGLTSLDVSNFNTNKVTDMSWLFAECEYLTSLNLSNFDTSKVTDMGHMFYECERLTSLNTSNWDTSKVTDMQCMFYNCYALGMVSTLDLSHWDTSSVTNMGEMFYVPTVPSGYSRKYNLRNWNTMNVTTYYDFVDDRYTVRIDYNSSTFNNAIISECPNVNWVAH